MTLITDRYSSRRSPSSGAVQAARAAPCAGSSAGARAKEPASRGASVQRDGSPCNCAARAARKRCTAATAHQPRAALALTFQRNVSLAAQRRSVGKPLAVQNCAIQEYSAHSARSVAMHARGSAASLQGTRLAGQRARALLALHPVSAERVACRAAMQRAPLTAQLCGTHPQEANLQKRRTSRSGAGCATCAAAVRRCRMRATTRWRLQRGSSQFAVQH